MVHQKVGKHGTRNRGQKLGGWKLIEWTLPENDLKIKVGIRFSFHTLSIFDFDVCKGIEGVEPGGNV